MKIIFSESFKIYIYKSKVELWKSLSKFLNFIQIELKKFFFYNFVDIYLHIYTTSTFISLSS